MRKNAFAFGLVLVLVSLLASTAAMGRTRPRGSAPGSRERQDQRAEIIEERLELVIARFNNNKERHVATYRAVKVKITELVTTMSAKGYDTAKLASDLREWDAMVLKTAEDYATLIGLLQTALQYAPYRSEGRFADAMRDARAQLRVVRKDALDARHMYQTVIRPDVRALAGQAPSTPGGSSRCEGGSV